MPLFLKMSALLMKKYLLTGIKKNAIKSDLWSNMVYGHTVSHKEWFRCQRAVSSLTVDVPKGLAYTCGWINPVPHPQFRG